MFVRARRGSIALAIAASLILTLAGTAQAAPVIRGVGTSWSPVKLRVDKGTVVRWRGVSNFHHIRAYGGNWSFSRDLAVGTTVRHRFRHRGTFRFYCTIHGSVSGGVCSGMCGRVRVV
jgi:plastocyanin